MSIFLDHVAEKAAVKALGDDIGFGRIIQLAHQCWDEMLEAKHGIKGHSEAWTLASADIIRDRRSSELPPVGSERSDEGNLPPDEPILPAQATQVASDPTANADVLKWRVAKPGRFITISQAEENVGNAVLSPEEDEPGCYWTLIGQGPEDQQNALAEIIAAALNANPDTSRHVDGAEENARLRQALQELDAVLGDTPMPNCATMNRLIKASANARAALSHPEGQSALVEAARAMADDYQTSPKHHPQHVLVPLSAFEAMRAALAQPDPLTETSGRVDGSGELLLAVKALGALPEGYCFCSRDRVGDNNKVHEPECAELRAAIAKSEIL